MEQISPYYSWLIKGINSFKQNTQPGIAYAIECFINALTFSKTEEAYSGLLTCYAKQCDDDNYLKTLERAVDDGFTIYYSSLGLFYAQRPGHFNKEKSLSWFEKGIANKDAKAYCDLANLYMSGCKAFEKDAKKGAALLLSAMKLDDPTWNGYICWALGKYCCEEGEYGVALEHFYKAVECGYKKANLNLAIMYRDGLGVKKDLNKYISHLLKDLSPESAVEIGGIYLTEQYAPKDDYIAFMHFDYAARGGNPIGAIMAAAYIVRMGNYKEEQLNMYLEVAFKNGANDQNMKESYQIIEDAFGKDVKNKLEEYASKYWNIQKAMA